VKGTGIEVTDLEHQLLPLDHHGLERQFRPFHTECRLKVCSTSTETSTGALTTDGAAHLALMESRGQAVTTDGVIPMVRKTRRRFHLACPGEARQWLMERRRWVSDCPQWAPEWASNTPERASKPPEWATKALQRPTELHSDPATSSPQM